MARAWQIEYEEALYHVLTRGNQRRDLVVNDDQVEFFSGPFDLLVGINDLNSGQGQIFSQFFFIFWMDFPYFQRTDLIHISLDMIIPVPAENLQDIESGKVEAPFLHIFKDPIEFMREEKLFEAFRYFPDLVENVHFTLVNNLIRRRSKNMSKASFKGDTLDPRELNHWTPSSLIV